MTTWSRAKCVPTREQSLGVQSWTEVGLCSQSLHTGLPSEREASLPEPSGYTSNQALLSLAMLYTGAKLQPLISCTILTPQHRSGVHS